MQKTVFEIPKMDCPSEENLIRLKLKELENIARLDFDLSERRLTVYHSGNLNSIESAITGLNLGGKKILTEISNQTTFTEGANQKKVLWAVFLIKFSIFFI